MDPKVLYFRLKELAADTPVKAALGVDVNDVRKVAHGDWTVALQRLIAAGFIAEEVPSPKTEFHRISLIDTFGRIPDTLYRVSFDSWDDARLETP